MLGGVSLSCMTQTTSTDVQGPLEVGYRDSDSGYCQHAHMRPAPAGPSLPHGGPHPSRAGPAWGCEPEPRAAGPGAGPSGPGRSRIECVGPEAGAGPIILSRAVSRDRVESGARVGRAGDVRGGCQGPCAGGGHRRGLAPPLGPGPLPRVHHGAVTSAVAAPLRSLPG
jgi:hypothetical protein